MKESPHFLLMKQDPNLQLDKALQMQRRYLGEFQENYGKEMWHLLHRIQWLAFKQMKANRQKEVIERTTTQFTEGGLVLVKKQDAKGLEDKWYKPQRILRVRQTTILVLDPTNKTETWVHKSNCKPVLVDEAHLSQEPNLDGLGRLTKYVIDPSKIQV